jgi:hypothetical protein
MPKSSQLLAQRLHHSAASGSAGSWSIGGHDVVDGGEGAVGNSPSARGREHAEGLGRGDLVDEVGADEELRAAVGEVPTVWASQTF